MKIKKKKPTPRARDHDHEQAVRDVQTLRYRVNLAIDDVLRDGTTPQLRGMVFFLQAVETMIPQKG